LLYDHGWVPYKFANTGGDGIQSMIQFTKNGIPWGTHMYKNPSPYEFANTRGEGIELAKTALHFIEATFETVIQPRRRASDCCVPLQHAVIYYM
jgi:hypothetical protein